MDFERISEIDGNLSKAGPKNTPWWKEHVKKIYAATTFDNESGQFHLPPHMCFMCGELKAKEGGDLKRCGDCHACRYCSRECQKKHWKYHKLYCGAWQEYEDALAAEKESKQMADSEEEFQDKGPRSPEDGDLAELLSSMDIETPRLKARHDYIAQATGRVSPSMSRKIMQYGLGNQKK